MPTSCTTSNSWTPRCSSLGGYLACGFRAYLDRLAHALPPEVGGEPDDTRYADFGTICHHAWQTTIGATFREGSEPPTSAQRLSAARLTMDNEQAMAELAGRVANRAAGMVLATIDAPDWLAETSVSRPGYLTGHIDLWSPTTKDVIDLKTASRKPDHQRMKAEHLVQLIGYYLLLDRAPERGHICYIDSRAGAWGLWCTVDFRDQNVQTFVNDIDDYIRWLNGPDLTTATPRPGPHCSGAFCKHRTGCRDSIVPPPGLLTEFDRVTSTRGVQTQGLA